MGEGLKSKAFMNLVSSHNALTSDSSGVLDALEHVISHHGSTSADATIQSSAAIIYSFLSSIEDYRHVVGSKCKIVYALIDILCCHCSSPPRTVKDSPSSDAMIIMLRRNWNWNRVTSYSKLVNSSNSSSYSFHNLNHLRSSFSSSSNLHLSPSAPASKATDLVSLARHYGKCYSELSKARLSLLVVATSGTGFVLGSGGAVDLSTLSWTCLGTMMVAASASSLNQVFEVNNDAKMKRTIQRPLPSGRITIPHAIGWASSVGLAGTALLASQANMLAAGLAASNLILYAFVYTPLKQIHPVNTWVGAVVGAIPPLLGWAAASGDISLNSLILPAALYFWQIPHFMALAYMCRNDYAAGGFKMYSLADPSGRRTALVALRNSIYLIPLGFLAYDWGVTSGWFSLESTVLTLAISAAAFSFYRDRTKEKARRMFHASLLYLPVFMSGLLIHRRADNQQFLEDNAKGFVKSSSSMETSELDDKNGNQLTKGRRPFRTQGRPPVAYASVAPFPFLPAPSYNDGL